MKGMVYLFVGVILIGVGITVSLVGGRVKVQGVRQDAETSQMINYGIGGGLGGLGVIFGLMGLISLARGSAQGKRNQVLMQTGVDAEGTVTFVDRNWTMRVNGNPIYSIVEYVYRDAAGNQHTRRITNAPSDIVIRRGIQVGGKVPVKYSAQNPAESLLVIS